MVAFDCQSCGQQILTADEYAGRWLRCKQCGATMRVGARENADAPFVDTPVEPITVDQLDEVPAIDAPIDAPITYLPPSADLSLRRSWFIALIVGPIAAIAIAVLIIYLNMRGQ